MQRPKMARPHYQGPWKTRQLKTSIEVLASDGRRLALVLAGTHTTKKADAALMAGAPELLKAALDVANEMLDYVSEGGDARPSQMLQWADELSAAIAASQCE